MKGAPKAQKAIEPEYIEGEEWRQIPGEPMYDVSNFGRIRSWTTHKGIGIRATKPRLRMLKSDAKGYLCVDIYANRTRSRRILFVHKTVLLAFVGPRSPGLVIRHLDGNPSNNRLENLCYGTHAQNMADAVKHGSYKGIYNGRHKLSEIQVLQIRDRILAGDRHWVQIGRDFGVSETTARDIGKGRRWRHLTGLGRASNKMAA